MEMPKSRTTTNPTIEDKTVVENRRQKPVVIQQKATNTCCRHLLNYCVRFPNLSVLHCIFLIEFSVWTTKNMTTCMGEPKTWILEPVVLWLLADKHVTRDKRQQQTMNDKQQHIDNNTSPHTSTISLFAMMTHSC
jgi:hypothetical protein